MPLFDRLSQVPSSQLIVAQANLDGPPIVRARAISTAGTSELAPLSRR